MNRTGPARPGATDPRGGSSQACAIVLAGGRGERLGALTDRRCKPALPFAGHLRVIDFAIDNCLNAGIDRITVLAQYRAGDLVEHLARPRAGREAGGSIEVVVGRPEAPGGVYRGTADAVHRNLDRVRASGARQVLVLAGDHVYRMDYRRMLAEHRRSGAAATVACIEVPRAQASAFGIVSADASGRVIDFVEKPAQPPSVPGRADVSLASMGVYVFDVDALRRALEADAHDPCSAHDFGHSILPAMVARGLVHAHRFGGSCVGAPADAPYWRDVGTIDAYWRAHMDLARERPLLDLHDAGWPILGAAAHAPPARFEGCASAGARTGCSIVDTLVAPGCVVTGSRLRGSVLSAGVRVSAGCELESVLLLPGVVVGRNVVLRCALVDQGCVLPDGLQVGLDAEADRARFHVTAAGVTLVTAAALETLRTASPQPSLQARGQAAAQRVSQPALA
jgi:glucose-1-phosphate adenylyltransferase